jgi:hypothetical protein
MIRILGLVARWVGSRESEQRNGRNAAEHRGSSRCGEILERLNSYDEATEDDRRGGEQAERERETEEERERERRPRNPGL